MHDNGQPALLCIETNLRNAHGEQDDGMVENIRRAMGLLLASVAMASVAGVVYMSAQPEAAAASATPIGMGKAAVAQDAEALDPLGLDGAQPAAERPQPAAQDGAESAGSLAAAGPSMGAHGGQGQLPLDLDDLDDSGGGQAAEGHAAADGSITSQSSPAKMSVFVPPVAPGTTPWLVGGGVAAVAAGGTVVAGVAMSNSSHSTVRSPAGP
jgi:hypothetical protein